MPQHLNGGLVFTVCYLLHTPSLRSSWESVYALGNQDKWTSFSTRDSIGMWKLGTGWRKQHGLVVSSLGSPLQESTRQTTAREPHRAKAKTMKRTVRGQIQDVTLELLQWQKLRNERKADSQRQRNALTQQREKQNTLPEFTWTQVIVTYFSFFLQQLTPLSITVAKVLGATNSKKFP